MAYWLPMRSDTPERILISKNESNRYTVRTKFKEAQEWTQLSLFEEVCDD